MYRLSPLHWLPKRLSFEIFVRIVADICIVNVALVLAFVVRYLWLIGVEDIGIAPRAVLHRYVDIYLQSFWVLTLVSLSIFLFSGFYTYSRIY
ncbi:MAG: hypothetical protein HC828_11715, partial [Blastochloris sp.]|nr:hypothetical protein [Blastochloris sp.]